MKELESIRNHLFENRFNAQDQQLLKEIKEKIENLKGNPFRLLALDAIENCERDIQKNDWDSAARELNFICHFPLNDKLDTWSEGYFYKSELLSYIGTVKDDSRIKKIIIRLAELQKELEKI